MLILSMDKAKKEIAGGILFLLVSGGYFGEKGTPNVLTRSTNHLQRIKLDCLLFFHSWCKLEYANETSFIGVHGVPLSLAEGQNFWFYAHMYGIYSTPLVLICEYNSLPFQKIIVTTLKQG